MVSLLVFVDVDLTNSPDAVVDRDDGRLVLSDSSKGLVDDSVDSIVAVDVEEFLSS